MPKPRPNDATETAPTPITLSVATEAHIRKCHEWVLKHLDHCPPHLLKYVEAGVRTLVAKDIAKADKRAADWNRIIPAIMECGRDAKPDVILKAARVNRKSGRELLRFLADLNGYHGHTKRRSAVYPRPS